MRCPHCGEYEMHWVETTCPDLENPGEFLSFLVCKNCDNGINDHTEGQCDCQKPRVSVEWDEDQKIKVVIKGLSASVFSILTVDEAKQLRSLLERSIRAVEGIRPHTYVNCWCGAS